MSTDFIMAFVLYFTAFSIFSYFIFAVEEDVFVQQSLLKDAHYDFDQLEQNAADAGILFGTDFHVGPDINQLLTLSYPVLKEVVLNKTLFAPEASIYDVCVYMVNVSEDRRVYFHAGQNSVNITLKQLPDVGCGSAAQDISIPFPSCGDLYGEGFAVRRLYFHNVTKQTVALTIQLCKRSG